MLYTSNRYLLYILGLSRYLCSSHRSSECSKSISQSRRKGIRNFWCLPYRETKRSRLEKITFAQVSETGSFFRREKEEMSKPVNISSRIPRAALEQPKYRTEGCLPASLAASSRLKKPRKDGGGQEKKGKKERRRAGEKNCAPLVNGLRILSSPEEKRNEYMLSII